MKGFKATWSWALKAKTRLSQLRKHGFCLRTRKKSKKKRNFEKNIFLIFFGIVKKSTQPTPLKQSNEEIPLVPRPKGTYFFICLFEGGGLESPPQRPLEEPLTRLENLTWFLGIKKKKQERSIYFWISFLSFFGLVAVALLAAEPRAETVVHIQGRERAGRKRVVLANYSQVYYSISI